MTVDFGINQVEISLGDAWIPEADVRRVLSGIKAVGASRIRVGAAWQFVQTSPGVYSWANLDRALNLCQAYGLRPLLLLSPPAPYFGASATDFGNFAKALANRYGPNGTNQVADYELYNEQNSVGNMSPCDPATFAPYIKAGYTGIKTVHPVGSTVVTGGVMAVVSGFFTTDALAWIQGIYKAGCKGYFDAVGFHPYTNSVSFAWEIPALTQTFIAEMAAAHVFMVAQGDTTMKIWPTEFGFPSPTLSLATCTAYMAAEVAIMQSLSWVGPWFLYNYRNSGTDTTNINNQWGLVDFNFTPKQPLYDFVKSISPAGAVAVSTAFARMSATLTPAFAVTAGFVASAGMHTAVSSRQIVNADFSAVSGMSISVFGHPPGPFTATASMSAVVGKQYSLTAGFTATATQGAGVSTVRTITAAFTSTASMSTVVGQQKLYSYDFTGTGSTKPTSLFTDFGQGYAVQFSIAKPSLPGSPGTYFSGGIYKTDQLSADHFAEVIMAPGSSSNASSDRSSMAIVRSDPSGANWVGAVGHWGGSDSCQIVTCISGTIAERAGATASLTDDNDVMRLTADGTTYTLSKNGVTVVTWVDSTGIFPTTNLRTGFGFQHILAGGVHYQPGGIAGLWKGYDVRLTVSPTSFPPTFTATATMSAAVSQGFTRAMDSVAAAAMNVSSASNLVASYTFTGSTKPTSLFTTFATGSGADYGVSSSIANTTSGPSFGAGTYFTGGVYKTPCGGAAHYSDVTWAGDGSSTDRGAGVIVAANSTGTTGVLVAGRSWTGSSATQIYTLSGGTLTSRQTGSTTWTTNDVMKVVVTLSGGVYTYTVFKNGVSTGIAWTDSSSVFTPGNYVGFATQGVTSGGVNYIGAGIKGTWHGGDN